MDGVLAGRPALGEGKVWVADHASRKVFQWFTPCHWRRLHLWDYPPCMHAHALYFMQCVRLLAFFFCVHICRCFAPQSLARSCCLLCDHLSAICHQVFQSPPPPPPMPGALTLYHLKSNLKRQCEVSAPHQVHHTLAHVRMHGTSIAHKDVSCKSIYIYFFKWLYLKLK